MSVFGEVDWIQRRKQDLFKAKNRALEFKNKTWQKTLKNCQFMETLAGFKADIPEKKSVLIEVDLFK